MFDRFICDGIMALFLAFKTPTCWFASVWDRFRLDTTDGYRTGESEAGQDGVGELKSRPLRSALPKDLWPPPEGDIFEDGDIDGGGDRWVATARVFGGHRLKAAIPDPRSGLSMSEGHVEMRSRDSGWETDNGET